MLRLLRIIGRKYVWNDAEYDFLLELAVIHHMPSVWASVYGINRHDHAVSARISLEMSRSTYVSSFSTSSCSDDDACWDVEQNRMKYSCLSLLCSRLIFAT